MEKKRSNISALLAGANKVERDTVQAERGSIQTAEGEKIELSKPEQTKTKQKLNIESKKPSVKPENKPQKEASITKPKVDKESYELLSHQYNGGEGISKYFDKHMKLAASTTSVVGIQSQLLDIINRISGIEKTNANHIINNMLEDLITQNKDEIQSILKKGTKLL